MRINGRLRRLEEAAGVGRDDGCPACRERRGRFVFTVSQRMPDGTEAPEGEWPAPCGVCGYIPESVINVVKPPEKDGCASGGAAWGEEGT